MLVLTRQLHQRIVLPTIAAAIEVVALKGKSVRLGVEAPVKVPIFRGELLQRPGTTVFQLPPPSQAEMELERTDDPLRQQLNVLALEIELIRRHIGDAMPPGLQEIFQRMERAIHRDEEPLKVP